MRIALFFLSFASLSFAGHVLLCGSATLAGTAGEKFVALSGGSNAQILFVPWAASDALGAFEEFQARIGEGVKVDVLPSFEAMEAGHAGGVEEKIAKATGVFFGGGNQRLIRYVLNQYPTLQGLFQAKAKKVPFGGSSAGTVAMGERMVSGRGNYDAIGPAEMEIMSGLGILTGVILDSHFIERQRQNRLLSALLGGKETLGLGVDAGACGLIEDGRYLTVYSRPDSWVMVVDAQEKPRRFQTDLLKNGDRYDLKEREWLK